MAFVYNPLRGNIGVVQFSHYDDNVLVNTVLINVIDYSEPMEASSFNKIYEDINGNLIVNSFGYRQTIKFSVVNSDNFPMAVNSTKSNRRCIQEIAMMINDQTREPDRYRTTLKYRWDDNISLAINAVYTGDRELVELVEGGNVAQIINLEFKSVDVSNQFNLGDDADAADPDRIVFITEGSVAPNEVIFITEHNNNIIEKEVDPYDINP